MAGYDHEQARQTILAHLRAHPVGLTVPELARAVGWGDNRARAYQTLIELGETVRRVRVATPGCGPGFKMVWFAV